MLTNAINDTNADVRDTVIRVIGTSTSDEQQAVRQLLIDSLKDASARVRLHAAGFLLNKTPDLVMPVLGVLVE